MIDQVKHNVHMVDFFS